MRQNQSQTQEINRRCLDSITINLLLMSCWIISPRLLSHQLIEKFCSLAGGNKIGERWKNNYRHGRYAKINILRRIRSNFLLTSSSTSASLSSSSPARPISVKTASIVSKVKMSIPQPRKRPEKATTPHPTPLPPIL